MLPASKRREWDYVIVGGGTAGCVLASRLTEATGASVLLLEAGNDYSRTLSVPLAGLRRAPAFCTHHQTVPQQGLSGRTLVLRAGKVVGGSSSVNGMIYYRGPAASYDLWEQLGNPGWSFADVLPYFLKSETFEDGASPYHGGSGPLHVARPRHISAFSRTFVEACMECGIPYNDDFNGSQVEGAGYYSVMQRRGLRSSAASGYLNPVRHRRPIEVRTNAVVRRIVLDGSRAAGVELAGHDAETLFATREVILSAGAFCSPKILMLSGIGPADYLRRIGIPPQVDLPGVGENFRDHIRIPVLYESQRRSPGARANWIRAALDYAIRRRGVLVSNCCESGAVVRTDPSAPLPDIQFVTHFQSPLARCAVDLQICVMPCSVPGTVRAASADPAAPPLIDPKYLLSDADVCTAIRGIRLARTIAAAPALRAFPLGAELLPGGSRISDAEIATHCRATAETCFHYSGTCKMGSDPLAVVDHRLRVRGVEGLRVVDASVMPDLPGGNLCAPVLMIAEKAADLIAKA